MDRPVVTPHKGTILSSKIQEPTSDADENEDVQVLITTDTDAQILNNPDQAMKLKQEQLRRKQHSYDGHYGPGSGGDDHTTLNMSAPYNLVR
ncbi:Aste57867_18605 [Aphanomyces stellatus]|uniref:Aste57867_18605 protein n=1 Tax=Aphanomyces stellatus TaxID=120398 RepID=A0A485LEB9_9STRA|nr:hypothetical protein As57867_018543 [Aphanomyces stellatus]VFT95340.1 Aste57867_18605 [Aphanomyces stellatus]